MTTARPRIAAHLAAELIDAAPGRVRKRIDASPAAADDWIWQFQDDHWRITAGEETVTLRPSDNQVLVAVHELSCSCLLTPKCFHLLACITTLAYADAADAAPPNEHPSDQATASTIAAAEPAVARSIATSDEETSVEVTAEMRDAAARALLALGRLLAVGCRSAGVLLQSSLLRASHESRAVGLVNLSHGIVRIVEGIQRLRSQDDHADAQQLRQDVIGAVRLASELSRASHVPRATLGQVRRRFAPVAVSKLVGMIAEPIWTLSGYAGVCVHLRANDGRLYQVIDARPGDVDLVQQAYAGGIDLGGISVPASQLSRRVIAGQNLTASADGRLGKGTQTRWAMGREPAAEQSFPEDDFARPLRDQLEAVLERASGDTPDRRGGWDLIAAEGTILGPRGATVLLQCNGTSQPLRLGIAIDDDRLHFRRNMQWIAKCPGLRLRVYARVRIDIAGRIDPLTITLPSPDTISPSQQSGVEHSDETPLLALPQTWAQRCHLGLDELQRHHFTASERFAEEVSLQADDEASGNQDFSGDHTLTARLDRKLVALILGGRRCVQSIASPSHRRERDRLLRRYQTTAAQLSDALAAACARGETTAVATAPVAVPLTTVVAALQVYCDAAKQSGYRDRWLQWLGDEP